MKDTRFIKFVVLVNCAVPALVLGWDAWRGKLGADPGNYALLTTGLMALIFLVLSLLITPVRKLTGLNWLIAFRRTLGLYAFFYALAHLLIYYLVVQSGDLSSTVSEIFSRWFLVIGMLSLTIMLPLALTSTNGIVKWLGAKNWQALHRLIYVAAIAGGLHYYLQAKADKRQPTAFLIAIGVLLGYRFVVHYFQLLSARRQFHAASTVPALAPSKPKFWSGQLKLAQVFDETPDVRTFRLVPTSGTDLPFDYQPGQYLNLSLMVDGKRVNRSYTIASSPTRRGYCELTVKREEQGISSRYLHGSLKPGDLLNVSAPAGRFTFIGSESDSVVLIAGGVGITPLMSKIRYLTDLGWAGEIYLIFAVRTERDIIFRDELVYLQSRHPNLCVIVTLSRQNETDWAGERGRITPDMLSRAVPQLSTRRCHLCGPDAMAMGIKHMLRELGVPDEQIKFESFTPPARSSAETSSEIEPEPSAAAIPVASNGFAVVTFSRSGKSKKIPADKTVLETAEDLGIYIDFNCRSGVCGTCKTKLLSGRVTMEVDDALNPGERKDNFILCCQARCVGDVTVDA